MRLRPLTSLATLAVAAVVAACGGSSPTEPSAAPPPAPPTATGATISGQISNGGTASGSREGIASPRATPVSSISVVGTSLTTSADSAGRFTLTGVPAGAIQLRFTGPGTDATVSVGELRVGDSVTLTVAVNGSA